MVTLFPGESYIPKKVTKSLSFVTMSESAAGVPLDYFAFSVFVQL